MSTELPHLDACVRLYLDVWETYGEDRFEEGDVVELREREFDGETVSASGVGRHLDLLTAYGLLDRIGDDAYRVRCTPSETELEWRDRFEERVERLYEAIHTVEEERTAGTGERLITYRGRTYVSVFVDPETTVADVADRVRELVAEDELRAGLALRCPADEARAAQRIADDLVGGDGTSVTSLPFAFEKVNSEVKGADDESLQFRLYVAPADRD